MAIAILAKHFLHKHKTVYGTNLMFTRELFDTVAHAPGFCGSRDMSNMMRRKYFTRENVTYSI